MMFLRHCSYEFNWKEDMNGSSFRSTDHISSAISALEGTMYVPYGSKPVNEYNNPSLWLGSYPWLFLMEKVDLK